MKPETFSSLTQKVGVLLTPRSMPESMSVRTRTCLLVPSTQEYFTYFGLDEKKLGYAKSDALVMHPGPMNRGVEISSAVADGAQSLIREQVEMGVAVRMAVLEALSRNLPNA